MNNDSKAAAEFLDIDAAEVEDAVTASTPEGTAVHIRLIPQGRECPRCGSENAEAKGRVAKKLRHSLFLSRPTLFVYMQRKYRCRECGRTFYEPNPFAARFAKVTVETEMLAIEALHRQLIHVRGRREKDQQRAKRGVQFPVQETVMSSRDSIIKQ